MKNNVLFLLTFVFITLSIELHAQRGARIAYIDTEYILKNIPEYQEAITQLNEKATKWKNEISEKLGVIEQKRKELSNEKALLTKDLIDEREEDITFEEKEILDYQQKRFGPNGDLFIQQKRLMQPIQDQIFAAVQDLASSKKYDFIFDKSSYAAMLFSAKRYDLSEYVKRVITRSSKRAQAQSKSEKKSAKNEELIPEINEEVDDRKKALEAKKAEREKALEKRRKEILAAREAKKKKALDLREAKKQKLDSIKNKAGGSKLENIKGETKTKEELIQENIQRKLKEREARKKALEEKKKEILENRKKIKDSLNKK